jgi:2-polyprenyl-3-methyl-5-hydroxy-6-metoxy-1,4-benzoquinol methylase
MKDKMPDDYNKTVATNYEKNQQFNFLVSYLHSIRYKYLNELFEEQNRLLNRTIRVVEIGYAHAKSFSLLNTKFDIDYVGIELKSESVEVAKKRYGSCSNFQIINDSIENHSDKLKNADVVLVLEVLEHIPENLVVRIVEQISKARPGIFLCTVPNEVGFIVFIKNFSSLITGYMRHREYSWKETFNASLYRPDKIGIHSTGHKGFDWRWLAQTLRHNMKITKIYSNPLRWLPKKFSFSIIFFCCSQEVKQNKTQYIILQNN